MRITGAKVFSELHKFEEKEVYVKDGLFSDSHDTEEIVDAKGLMLIPGLVDIHFHGAVGHDFCDGDKKGLMEIAEYEASCGITAICPATMTYSEEILTGICRNAADFRKEGISEKAADLVGINMEGPFISPDKLGAQNPEYLHEPDVPMFKRLQQESGGLIKLVDIAPEVQGSMDFIRELRNEVCISLAHTCADYETALKAFDLGTRHMTHLYNAMPGISHREPGPIIAALEKRAEVELIADSVHVDPAMVRFTFNTFGEDRVILISDSMEATGLPDGEYSLGGQSVTVRGNRAVLTSDQKTIAGSVTNLFDCMKCAVLRMGIPLEKAVIAATENPALAIGIFDRYGSITSGKVASAVLMDEDLNIKKVLLRGSFL
ncbi:N-acetylglucosamine-6-phosphate deacetylase [Butyrivibrio sp. MC2021]|uniref:N-acetylglucosamine-6-phosphate deacetylase n=1 Tax=Butyrivibrio sp. MC2021 TaxID=1408306 RepID=UPI00047E0F91|nr:N-acetylglucosamine-6-phosphate deacetylase [Butyrivibrio sp. MC2021]